MNRFLSMAICVNYINLRKGVIIDVRLNLWTAADGG